MADEIVLKVVVQSDLANKSIGDLKQDFKDLTKQVEHTIIGTEEYKKTLTSLGVVKGGLQDLKQQIQALNPEKQFAAIAHVGSTIASGFAAAQGAVALFGGESEDLQKVLVRVQSAMALAQGLQGLSGFAKALETARLAMIAFGLSNPITAIIAGVTALAAGVVVLTQAWQDSNSESGKMKVAIEKLNKVYEEQKYQLNEQLRLLEAQKGKEEDVIKIKRELIAIGVKEVELNLFLAEAKRKEAIEQENYIDIVTGFFSPAAAAQRKAQRLLEAQQEITDNKKKLDSLLTDLKITFIDEQEIKDKKIKKAASESEKDRIDELKASVAHDKELMEMHLELLREGAYAERQIKQDAIDAELNADDLLVKHELEFRKKNSEKIIALDKFVADTKKQLSRDAFTAVQNLSDTIFANALLKAHGNAEAERKIKKNQFNLNKSVSILHAGINTAEAITKTIAELGGVGALTPPGLALIAAIGAIGAVEIGAIAAKKFPEGNGDAGGGGAGATPNFGGGGAPDIQSPQGQTFKANNITGVNQDENGNFAGFGVANKQMPLRAYVVETDITSSQTNINRIETNAKY